MDFVTLLLIAIGLAMDAFSVAVTDGIVLKKVTPAKAMKVGVFFGGFQFVMPCIGWALGSAFARYIESCDHWIAFILLAFIGGKMLFEALGKKEDEVEVRNPLDSKVLTLLAIATSIDALAVGVTFATMNVSVLYASGVIGIVAFLFSFAGICIGNKFGDLFGNKAEIAGGAVLILIGIKILIEHLFF